MFSKLNPYLGAAKLIGVGLAVLFIVTLAFSWLGRGQEIAALTAWQNTVVISATDATVQPDAKGIRKPLTPAAVPAAIAGLKRSWDSCQTAAQEMTDATSAAKARAEAADKALANAQVLMQGEYSSAAKRIDALAQKKAQPTPELQCQATASDSKAAWEAWK